MHKVVRKGFFLAPLFSAGLIHGELLPLSATLRETFSERYADGAGLLLVDTSSESLFGSCDTCAYANTVLEALSDDGFFPRLKSGLTQVQIDEEAIARDTDPGSVSFEKFVLTARLQDTLEKTGTDAGSATFALSTGDSESLVVNAALILDAYLPSNWILGGYQTGPDGYGLHFRAGALINRASGIGEEIDYREYFLGANLLAPTLGNREGLRSALGSEMDFGFSRKENHVTDDFSHSIEVRWKPLYRKIFGREIPISDLGDISKLFEKVEPTSNVAEIEEGLKSQPQKSSIQSEESNRALGKTRFSLQPNFGVEQFVENTAELEGTCLCAGFDFQLTTLEDRVKLSYNLDYQYLVENSQGYLFQKASLSYVFNNDLLRDVSFDVSYFNGERAPTFQNENLLTAGVGLQF